MGKVHVFSGGSLSYRIKLIIKEMMVHITEAFHFISKCSLWVSYCFIMKP